MDTSEFPTTHGGAADPARLYSGGPTAALSFAIRRRATRVPVGRLLPVSPVLHFQLLKKSLAWPALVLVDHRTPPGRSLPAGSCGESAAHPSATGPPGSRRGGGGVGGWSVCRPPSPAVPPPIVAARCRPGTAGAPAQGACAWAGGVVRPPFRPLPPPHTSTPRRAGAPATHHPPSHQCRRPGARYVQYQAAANVEGSTAPPRTTGTTLLYTPAATQASDGVATGGAPPAHPHTPQSTRW